MGAGQALSVRQEQTLSAVRAHYADVGRPPSYKELGERVGLEKSQSHDLVKALARLGLLSVKRTRGFRTQIRLTEPLEEIATADLRAELARRAGNDPEDLRGGLAA